MNDETPRELIKQILAAGPTLTIGGLKKGDLASMAINTRVGSLWGHRRNRNVLKRSSNRKTAP